MRRLTALVLVAAPACGGIRPGVNLGDRVGSTTARTSSLAARVTELRAKAPVLLPCFRTHGVEEQAGWLEVTAHADGKVTARPLDWTGDAAIAQCMVDEAQKIELLPREGPSVAALLPLQSPVQDGSRQATLTDGRVDPIALDAWRARLAPALQACALEERTKNGKADTRESPVDGDASVTVSMYLFPGGDPAGVNVVDATARRTLLAACVRDVVAKERLPDPHSPVPYPLEVRLDVPRVEEQAAAAPRE